VTVAVPFSARETKAALSGLDFRTKPCVTLPVGLFAKLVFQIGLKNRNPSRPISVDWNATSSPRNCEESKDVGELRARVGSR